MFKISDKPRKIRIFNYSEYTNEYINQGDYNVPPYTGLPANCTDTPPFEVESGLSVIFHNNQWKKIENHIGRTLYDTSTGKPIIINSLGEPPESTTHLEPKSIFDEWNGSIWVKNDEQEISESILKANEKKNALIVQATKIIDILIDANAASDVKKEEKKKLAEWKSYRLSLYRLDPDLYPDIEWPSQPIA